MRFLQQNIRFLLDQHPELSQSLGDDPRLSQLENLAENAGCPVESILLHNLEAQTFPWQTLKFIFLDVDGGDDRRRNVLYG